MSGILLVASVARAAASPAAVPTIQPDELQADVSVLERSFRMLHPGLLRYLNAEQADRSFGDLRRAFLQPQTLPQAYLAFARFAAKIRCGHTYANFFNQSKANQEILFEQTPRLPFYFRWIDGRMIVTRDFSSPALLPVGTEVVRINGVATASILARLMPLTRADGHNDAKRIDQLNVTGATLYESFDIYYPWVFAMKPGTLTLAIRCPGANALHTVSAHTLTYAQRIEPVVARKNREHAGADAVFEWRDLENGSGYLRMPTWAVFESPWDWRSWLNERLDSLAARNAPALIVDLRGNEGGDNVGDEILKRLVDHDLAVGGMKRLVRYRSVPADLLPYLHTWDPSFKDWGKLAMELDSPWPTAPPVRYFAFADEEPATDIGTVIHPAARHFAGQVFVLVDAANSSATFQFAQVVQQHRLGTLVGEPTGGNRRGINGGAFFFLQLPHTGIELDLPLIGTFPEDQEPDAGLTPDVSATTTAASIAAHSDAALEVVKALIARSSDSHSPTHLPRP